MVVDGNAEKIVHEIINLRFGLLQLLCLEPIYEKEAEK